MTQEKFYEQFYSKKEQEYFNLPWWSTVLKKILPGFYATRIDAAVKLVPRCGNLLDIGCGNGELIKRVADTVSEVYGLELSENRLTDARKKLAGYKNVHLSAADVNKGIPFEDGYFDCVTMIALIEHFYSPAEIIKEIRRILKDSGKLIIEFPNIGYIKDVLMLMMGRLPYPARDPGHLHVFTLRAVRRLLAENNFEIRKIRGSGNLHSIRNLWPEKMLSSIIIEAEKNG